MSRRINPYESPRGEERPRTLFRRFPFSVIHRRSFLMAAPSQQLEPRLRAWSQGGRYQMRRRGARSWELRRNVTPWRLFRAVFAWHVRDLPVVILIRVGTHVPARVGMYLTCRFPMSVGFDSDMQWLLGELADLEDVLSVPETDIL